MNKTPFTPLRRFFKLLELDRKEIFSIYLYALFNGLISLSLPLGIQAIISLLGAGEVSTSWVILVFFVILGVALSGIMQIMQLRITENLQQRIFTRSAFEFAFRIPRITIESVKKFHMPELVNRFFDTVTVQKGLSKILLDFSGAALQVFFGLILLCFYHPFFILFSLILVTIVVLIFKYTAGIGMRSSLKESKEKYEVAHWLEELARAGETFKMAGKSPLPLEKTDDLVSKYLYARKAHFKTLMIQYINMVGFKVLIAAGLLILGGLLVINQQMNLGQFVASEIIIILVLNSVEKLILSMETIYDVLTSLEKIGNVTDLPLDKATEHERIPQENGLSIQLKALNYSSENQELLRNLSLDIAAGEKICISGITGAGKSLLLQMLSGILNEYRGKLSYNHIPHEMLHRENLFTLIGDNLSKEDIFKGSLAENISLGKEWISNSNIEELCELLDLNAFVRSLPQGIYTQLLPEGKNIPKGIQLKIILARSLAGNPKMVLLEDNFNLLPAPELEEFVNYATSQPWTLVAATRKASIAAKFDRCIVLDNGKIIADASYEEVSKMPWFDKVFND